MRGDDEGTAEMSRKLRGVLVLSSSADDADVLREWARAQGLVVLGSWGDMDLESIRAVLRPPDSTGESLPESYGVFRVDPSGCDVTAGGVPLGLRRTERDVFVYLMRNSHRFVTPHELQEQVLKTHGDGGAARNQVYELRRKLRAKGYPHAIVTRPQLGYRLRSP